MKRLIVLTTLVFGALALSAVGFAGSSTKKPPKVTPNGGRLVFNVVTTDHGCNYRPWATDTLHRVYKVKRNEDGTYTVRREDKGMFKTLGGQSPSADPCPGVIRRGKHGNTVNPNVTGKIHGYIVGTVTGGTFNPKGTCTAECTNSDFIAGFFTPSTTSGTVHFTCLEGYAGCRFNFAYTAQRQHKQQLRYHHWVDRGLNGVNEIFIGDIANA